MIQAPTLYDPETVIPITAASAAICVWRDDRGGGVIDGTHLHGLTIATTIQITKPPGLRRAPVYFNDYVTAFVTKIRPRRRHLVGTQGYYDARHRTSKADAVEAVKENIIAYAREEPC